MFWKILGFFGIKKPLPPYYGERLTVSPFYCAGDDEDPNNSIWADDGLDDPFNGPSPATAFPISQSLQRHFRAWSRKVVKQMDWETDTMPPELDEEGLELARALKRELPHRAVEYWDSRGSTIVIA